MPIIFVIIPVMIRRRPPINKASLSQTLDFREKYPINALLTATIPIIAVTTDIISSQAVTSTKTKIGLYTNIYGTINAAIANFTAVTPLLNGFALAIPAPAYAAKHTGGVISATIPK